MPWKPKKYPIDFYYHYVAILMSVMMPRALNAINGLNFVSSSSLCAIDVGFLYTSRFFMKLDSSAIKHSVVVQFWSLGSVRILIFS